MRVFRRLTMERKLYILQTIKRFNGGTAAWNLAKIREEIAQHWLSAEAKNGNGTKAQYCSFTHQDGIKAYHKSSANWHWLDRELSSNVAGETGAVYIYKGALAAMTLRPTTLEGKCFVQQHMANEANHLQLFESIVPEGKHTILLPIWRISGWLLGFLPTLLGGNKALYITVEAVESFVEEHYMQQIQPLKQIGTTKELVGLLEHCCEDEVHHKEDAAQKLLNSNHYNSWWAQPWSTIVMTGSRIAADIARRI